MTSFSAATVSNHFFPGSVTSHALQAHVAVPTGGKRIPIHPGIRTSCQPPDTCMNPYRAILNLVVAHIAEIRSSLWDVDWNRTCLCFLECFDSRLKCVHRNRFHV
jgi:hypothetical protein